jgi:hypothetical protein
VRDSRDDLDIREPGPADLPQDVFWIIETDEICGELYLNDVGEYATCILHKHPPQTGHCDGVDHCDDYCDDPIGDVCRTAGLIDSHGLPTFEYFEHFEAI